jgi:transcriptional regulator with XRE-family HTH domain
MKFSDQLRLLRKARAWTQDELGREAELHPTAIAHYEAGRRKPSMKNLLALASAFGISTDELLGRKKLS